MNKLLRRIFDSYITEEDDLEYDALEYRLRTSSVDLSGLEKKRIYQSGKKRDVISFSERCYEEVLVKYLKARMDEEFEIKYPNRTTIMKSFFDLVETLPKLGDFIIYRFDFKNYYNSLSSRDIFDKYFNNVNLFRYEMDILETIINRYDKCYAGIATSNSLAEVVSRDFDEKLICELQKNGLVFYSRYVDDGIIVFSRYISESQIFEAIDKTISQVFKGHDVQLNLEKCKYVRSTDVTNSVFSYLGYRFEYTYTNRKFIYGISESKIDKFNNRYKKILLAYKEDGNMRLFKARYEFLMSRVVFYNQFDLKKNKAAKWDVIGIAESYRELKSYLSYSDRIDQRTKRFLSRDAIIVANTTLGEMPYFLKMRHQSHEAIERNMYLLTNRMKLNKSIVFHPKFGWTTEYLVKKILELDGTALFEDKSYPELVKIYCSIIKVKDVEQVPHLYRGIGL